MKATSGQPSTPNSEESLREALLDLKRARRAEHQLRIQNEVILEGLELLNSTEDDQEMFSKLLELLRDLLGFDEAFVLSGSPESPLEPVASTSPELDSIVWKRGALTERVLEGDPVASFRAGRIPEWREILDEIDLDIVSALHIGLRGDPNSSIIVCTHSEPGFFSPEHVQLGRRFSMLATQALVNRDLRQMKLRAFERSVRHQFFQVSSDLLGVLDFDAVIRQANPAFADHLGLDEEELKERSFLELVDPEDREVVERHLEPVVHCERSETFEARFRTTSDEVRWLQWNLSCGDEELIYAVGRDVTEQRETQREIERLNERLERLARTDELTGLYNRRYLRSRLSEEFERADRYETTFSLIYLDLDNFSALNNQYGHVVGDEALETIGSLLETGTRSSDVCARYGGDEFVILLPETGPDEAAQLAERLVSTFLDAELGAELEVADELGVSAGVATFDAELEDVDELFRRADEAMYAAKHSQNSPVIWSPDLDASVSHSP